MAYRTNPGFTDHSRKRMRQRGITGREVQEVLRRGRRHRSTDDVKVRVHEEQVEKNPDGRLYDLIGIVVVLTKDQRRVKTVFHGSKPKRSFEEIRHLNESGPSFKLGDLIGKKPNEEGLDTDDLRL